MDDEPQGVTVPTTMEKSQSYRWTADDLDDLPADGIRREVIDGELIVSPAPSPSHQQLIWRLCAALGTRCPDELDVNQGAEIRISENRVLIPDVMVLNTPPTERFYYRQQVVLAIEVVSEGSKQMDRLHKPALYAAAGIPSFWRIELEPVLAVHAYELSELGSVYRETEHYSDVIAVEQPWRIRIPLDEIRPRR